VTAPIHIFAVAVAKQMQRFSKRTICRENKMFGLGRLEETNLTRCKANQINENIFPEYKEFVGARWRKTVFYFLRHLELDVVFRLGTALF